MDRDENSAVNILARYMVQFGPPASMKKLARLGPPTSMEKASMEKQGVLCDGNDEVGVAVAPHFPVVQQLTLWK